jgi:hypothetical protein
MVISPVITSGQWIGGARRRAVWLIDEAGGPAQAQPILDPQDSGNCPASRVPRPACDTVPARALAAAPIMPATLADITTNFAHCQELFERHGCFVVDDAIDKSMLDELEAAARRVVARVQGGSDEYSLGVGGNAPGATQIGALLAPEYGEGVFQQMMGSDALAKYADLLLPPPIRLWFCALWCLNGQQLPERQGYDSSWHRDTSGILGTSWGEDVGAERELAILGVSPEQVGKSLKWTSCLNEGGDPCLFLCPGSHRRYRTAAERRALVADTNGAREPAMQPIEGEIQVSLKRGQTVFWAGTLVHRGYQPSDCKERLSMTCGLQAHNQPEVPLHKGHQFEWCQAPSIGPSLVSARTRGYWER